MKLKRYAAVGLVVWGLMVLVGYAYGACPPQWTPNQNSGCPNCNCDPVTLQQMGSFDALGNWNWNPTFETEMTQWLPTFPQEKENWVPEEILNWNPNTLFGLPQLHVQYKEIGQVTRFYAQLPSFDIVYPEVYRWTKPDGSFQAFVANFKAPEECVPPWNPGECTGPPDPDAENPCCRPWTQPNKTQRVVGPVISDSEVEAITLIQNGISTPITQMGVGIETLMAVNYDFQNPMGTSVPPSFSPVRQKYSYWTVPNPLWRYQNFPVLYRFSPIGFVPISGVPIEVIVRISGQDYQLHFLGGDTSSPPLIPLTTQVLGNEVNKGGKIKNKEIAVSTSNIIASEVDGNLIIQWGEAIVLEPYWQIRIFVGNQTSNELVAIPSTPLVYSVIEVPPLAGAAVLPAAAWAALKSAIQASGHNSAKISVYYRRIYQNNVSNGGGLQVRSQSNYIEFPF